MRVRIVISDIQIFFFSFTKVELMRADAEFIDQNFVRILVRK